MTASIEGVICASSKKAAAFLSYTRLSLGKIRLLFLRSQKRCSSIVVTKNNCNPLAEREDRYGQQDRHQLWPFQATPLGAALPCHPVPAPIWSPLVLVWSVHFPLLPSETVLHSWQEHEKGWLGKEPGGFYCSLDILSNIVWLLLISQSSPWC